MSEIKEYFPWSKGNWVEIKQKVKEVYGVELELEQKILGE